ncbi:hypothetical protein J6590_101303, partial [Homalodisca vitripennis]
QHYRQLQTILELISETQDSPWSPVIKVPCYVVGMTVGVGVCSLTSEALVNLNKGVPPPAYFDWRGWFTAGLPSSGMTLRCSALILPHGSR